MIVPWMSTLPEAMIFRGFVPSTVKVTPAFRVKSFTRNSPEVLS
jgi:hypothetical protein